MFFEINYKIQGMVVDFRSKNANTNLQRIFVEVIHINQQTWFHRSFFEVKKQKRSLTDVVIG